MQPPQLSCLHLLACRDKPDVKAPLKADLHLCTALLHLPYYFPGAGDVGGDWLLAEDGDPRLDCGADKSGVGVGGGSDNEAVDIVMQQSLGVLRPGHPHAGGDLPGPSGVGIDDNELLYLAQRMQCLGVQGSDPTDPHDPYPHCQFSFA